MSFNARQHGDVELASTTIGRQSKHKHDEQLQRLQEVATPHSVRDFLGAMENHLREHRFVLGNRPGSGDFGLYGQLTQLALLRGIQAHKR